MIFCFFMLSCNQEAYMRNVGGIDRVFRIIAGIVLALLAAFAGMAPGVRVLLIVFAVAAFFTGVFGF